MPLPSTRQDSVGTDPDRRAASGRYDPQTRTIIIVRTRNGEREADEVRHYLDEQAQRHPDQEASYRQIGRTIRVRPARLTVLMAAAAATALLTLATGLVGPAGATLIWFGIVALVTLGRHAQLLHFVRGIAHELGDIADRYPEDQPEDAVIETARVRPAKPQGDR